MYDKLIISKLFIDKKNEELKLITHGTNDKANKEMQYKNKTDKLNQIFVLMLEETESIHKNSEKLLSIYIKQNMNNLTKLLIKLCEFVNQNEIYYKFLIKCLKIVFNLLTEHFDIIYFINAIVPILVNILYKNNMTDFASIKEITNFIDELMKEGGIYSKEMIHNILENSHISHDNNENSTIRKYKTLYLHYAIIKNMSFADFFKIYKRKDKYINYDKVKELMGDKEINIRLTLGKIINQLIKLFYKGGIETKNKNINLLYSRLYSHFISHINNNSENKFFMISGFFILIKNIFLADPSFFKDNFKYEKLIEGINMFYTSNKNDIEVEIEYLKFIPELYKINKIVFKGKYQKYFMKLMNDLLDGENDIRIENQLLLSFGNLFEFIKDDNLLSLPMDLLLTKIKELINRKLVNDELLKCLTDLLDNNLYVEKIMDLIDIYSFLSIIFKPPLTFNKTNFVLSLLNSNKLKNNNNIIIIITLNAVSFIIDNEYFQFEDLHKNNKLSINLNNVLSTIKEEIFNYNNENEDNSFQSKNSEIIFNALILFSKIHNNLFYIDMMNYYCNKILPLLLNSNNKIKAKILDIVLCDFIKIYDDYGFSECNMKKITQNFIINMNSDDSITTEYIIEIFIKKEELLSLMTSKKNIFLKILSEILISQTNFSAKEKIIQIFNIFYIKNIEKNFVILIIQKIINDNCFNMINSRNWVLIEESSNLLLSAVFYFHKKLSNYIYNPIMSTLLYSIITNDYKGSIRINIFLLLNKLLDIDLADRKEKDIIFKTYLNILFIINVYYLKIRCNEDKYLPRIILKILYKLVLINNLDIFEKYNVEEYINENIDIIVLTNNLINGSLLDKLECKKKLLLIAKQLNNIRIIELLIPFFSQLEKNTNEIYFIVNILGLYENNSNVKYKIFNKRNFISSFFEEERRKYISDKKEKIKYKRGKSHFEIIDLLAIEPIKAKVVIFVMEFLKNNHRHYKELSNKLISFLDQLIFKIKPKESNLIDIILPTLLEIFPYFECNTQKYLLENIFLISNNFHDKTKSYVNEILKLLINYPINENFNLIFKLFYSLFTKFLAETQPFYSTIIQKFIFIIKNNNTERDFFIQLLALLCKNDYILPFLNGIIVELSDLFLLEEDKQCLSDLYILLENIICLNNSCIIYQILITILLEKIKKILTNGYFNLNIIQLEFIDFIVNKTLNIFSLMNKNYKIFFVPLLFQIISVFNSTGLTTNVLFKEKLKYLARFDTPLNFKNDTLKSEIFERNCRFGFNRPKINNGNKLNTKNKNTIYKKILYIKNENNNDYYNNLQNKTRTQKEILLETFDNSQCKNKEDWDEWLNATSNVLLEYSPSYFLQFCHHFNYLNTALTLRKFYDESFLSVYNNNDDEVKLKLVNSLKVILESKAVPDNIIIKTFELIDFLERNKISLIFQNFSKFGNLLYEHKFFYKAIYYRENEFLINSNKNTFENLTSLYYKLGTPESTIGLIKLIEQNFFKDMNDYDGKDILYFNMHQYDKCLEIINRKLLSEKNENTIEELKNKKFEYLYHLCDWESIITENENTNKNIDTNSFYKYSDENLNKILDEEYKLSVACANLQLWDKLKIHVNKINKILFENLDESKFDNEIINEVEEEENEQDHQKSSNDLVKKINIMMGLNSTNENKIKFSLFKVKQKLFDKSLKNNDLDFLDDLIVPYEMIFDKINDLDRKLSSDLEISLNLFSSAIKIYEKKYNLARFYINNVKNKIIKTITREKINEFNNSSLFEINDLFEKNYMIHHLELCLDYRQLHLEDENALKILKTKVDNIFQVLQKSPLAYAKLLSIHSLIFPIDYEFDKYIKLANMYRKSRFFEQEIKLLKRIKEKFKLNTKNIFNNKSYIFIENSIKFQLCYNKCLIEKGEINNVINNLKNLIDQLNVNESTINNILKSKIFANYAFYKMQKIYATKKNIICRKIYNNLFLQDNSSSTKFKSFSIDKKLNDIFFNIKEVKDNIHLSIKVFNTSHKDLKNSNNIFSLNQENILTIKNIVFKKDIEEINIINQYYMKSVYYNKDNYKSWENYGLFNYKIYRFIVNNQEIFIENLNTQPSEIKSNNNFIEIKYAMNAVNGFKNFMIIIGNDAIKSAPIAINLIDIFYESSKKNKELLSLISLTFNSIDLTCFLFLLSQLSYSVAIDNLALLEVLIKLLIKLTIKYPHYMIYYIIEMKLSNSQKIKSIANQIIYHVIKKDNSFKFIYDDYSFFIPELNNCSLLLHEEFLELFEIASKLYIKKENNKIIYQFFQFHQKIKQCQRSLYEINFLQSYGAELKSAENFLNKYLKYKNENYLNEAMEIYSNIYNNITKNFRIFEKISLEYISPKLSNLKNSYIAIPYYDCMFFDKNFKATLDYFHEKKKDNFLYKYILIKKIDNNISIFEANLNPRKIKMIGTNDKEYSYELKIYGDIRQEIEATQIIYLNNILLARDKIYANKSLYIPNYSVFSIPKYSSLSIYNENYNSLYKLIREQKIKSNSIIDFEKKRISNIYPNYESGAFLSKLEVYQDILRETSGTELKKVILEKSSNIKDWFIKRTNYSRTLAVSSILGYIMGLSDRNLKNIYLHNNSCKIFHKNYVNCFEFANFALNQQENPKKVPFRLTRTLIKALDIASIEGIFRLTCEKIMKLLRNNKSIFLTLLISMTFEPFIPWKYIFESKTIETKKIIQKNDSKNIFPKSLEIKSKKNNEINEFKLLNMESSRVFNMYISENDLRLNDLKKIVKMIINRMNEKLTGIDFGDKVLDVKDQVDKLIRQATSEENIVQNHPNWDPFW